MRIMTGGQALTQSLINNGVDTVFALPGLQLDHLFNAFYDAGDAIRIVQTRHEQGAAYMAFGYAQVSGKTGAYAVVPGPGLLNTTAALSTAYACKAPVLAITGQLPLASIGRGYGELHEIPDQLALISGLTKWAGRIECPGKAPEFVNEAFRQMHTGRKLPVELEMPMDAMGNKAEVELLPGQAMPAPAAPDENAVQEAARLLGQAKNPVIVYGSGVADSGPDLIELAEMLQAAIFSSRGAARGAVSDRHYLHQNLLGAQTVWKDADVVLAVGTRLEPQQSAWGVDDRLQIIHVEIDPDELGRFGSPAVGILADATLTLRELARLIPEHNISRSSRRAELSQVKEDSLVRLRDELGPQMAWVDALRASLDDDAIVVDELTQVGYAARFGFPVYHPRSYVISGFAGALGFGYATALGAKVACPERQVLSINGDGGFVYTMHELATAVQYGINVVAVVFNDNAFGNVRRDQIDRYDGRVIGSELHNPDFVALAESFGARGFKAVDPDELAGTIQQAFAAECPCVIEVPVGEFPTPFAIWAPQGIRQD